MKADWKSIIGWTLALAGIAVPIGLWQFDQNARAITARLVASSALQPAMKQAIPDIEISLGGVLLQSPYLSTIEVVNSGARPILASDFETPIELGIENGAAIVRASVSSTNPVDIKADLTSEKNAVKLKPLLLNPSDSVTISVITKEQVPKFAAKARVAGVSRIVFEDATTKEPSWKIGAGLYAGAILFAALYFFYAIAFIFPDTIRLSRPVALAAMSACSVSSSAILIAANKAVGVQSEELVFAIGLLLVAGAMTPLYIRAKRRHRATLR